MYITITDNKFYRKSDHHHHHHINTSRYTTNSMYTNSPLRIAKSHENQEYLKGDWYKDEEKVGEDRIVSYRICEVCRCNRPDWLRFHNYMNNSNDRQMMTMCMQSLRFQADKELGACLW